MYLQHTYESYNRFIYLKNFDGYLYVIINNEQRVYESS